MNQKILSFSIYLTTVILTFLYSDSYVFPQATRADNFIVYNVDGKRTVFYELFRNLPNNGMIILNFTSIYCKPCRKEIPELLKIANRSNGRSHLVIIYAETGADVKKNASSMGVYDMAYVDPFGNIRKQYNVEKIPATFIIKKNYLIANRFNGYSEDFIKQIEKL